MERNTTKLQYEQKMGNLLFKYYGKKHIHSLLTVKKDTV